MRKRGCGVGVALGCLCLAAGCTWGGNLDRSQHALHQQWYTAQEVLIAAGEKVAKASSEDAATLDELWATLDKMMLDQTVAKHTDPEGNVKAPASQVTAWVEDSVKRAQARAEALQSRAKRVAGWQAVLDRVGKLTAVSKAKDTDWQAAKEDAAAVLDAAIQSLVGAASGTLIGAGL